MAETRQAVTGVNPWPLPPVNEVSRARIVGALEGQMTVNTLYYRSQALPGNGTRAQADALFALLEGVGGLFDSYYAACSADWTHTFTIIDYPTNAAFAPVHYGMTLKGGTVVGGHSPCQMAVILNKKTVWKGKRGRGRISMPAVPLSWVTGTVLNTELAHKAVAANMVVVLADGTNTFTPGLYGHSKKGITPVQESWQDVVEVLVNPILGTIRRRRPGVGK